MHWIIYHRKLKINVMARRELTTPLIRICGRQTNCPGLSGTEKVPGMWGHHSLNWESPGQTGWHGPLVCAEAVLRNGNKDTPSSHLTEQFLIHHAFGLDNHLMKQVRQVLLMYLHKNTYLFLNFTYNFIYFLLIDKELDWCSNGLRDLPKVEWKTNGRAGNQVWASWFQVQVCSTCES